MRASTKLAKALVDTMSDMGEEVDQMMSHGHHHSEPARETKHGMQVLSAFSSFTSHSEIRYNKEKLEAAVCNATESQEHKEQIEMIKGALPHMLAPIIGEETVKALAGLKDHASHLHSIRLAGGLPADYEVYMEFENFHLTPVIAEFLQVPAEPAA